MIHLFTPTAQTALLNLVTQSGEALINIPFITSICYVDASVLHDEVTKLGYRAPKIARNWVSRGLITPPFVQHEAKANLHALYRAVNPDIPTAEYNTRVEATKVSTNPRISGFAPITEQLPGKLFIYLPYALAYIVRHTAVAAGPTRAPKMQIKAWPDLLSKYLEGQTKKANQELNAQDTPNLLLEQLVQQVRVLTTRVNQLELKLFEGAKHLGDYL
jgi:hypothetical protein